MYHPELHTFVPKVPLVRGWVYIAPLLHLGTLDLI